MLELESDELELLLDVDEVDEVELVLLVDDSAPISCNALMMSEPILPPPSVGGGRSPWPWCARWVPEVLEVLLVALVLDVL